MSSPRCADEPVRKMHSMSDTRGTRVTASPAGKGNPAMTPGSQWLRHLEVAHMTCTITAFPGISQHRQGHYQGAVQRHRPVRR
jgi:hypothetical protein